MDKEQCYTCTFCDFMTYSSAHLEKHTKTKHDGGLPRLVSKTISSSMSAKVRRDDASFHSGLRKDTKEPTNGENDSESLSRSESPEIGNGDDVNIDVKPPKENLQQISLGGQLLVNADEPLQETVQAAKNIPSSSGGDVFVKGCDGHLPEKDLNGTHSSQLSDGTMPVIIQHLEEGVEHRHGDGREKGSQIKGEIFLLQKDVHDTDSNAEEATKSVVERVEKDKVCCNENNETCSLTGTVSGAVKEASSGEKRFSCDLCSKTFSHRKNVRRHTKTHEGEKEFKCDECGESFNRNRDLEEHVRVHRGDKPHRCERCDMGFRRKSDLRTHMRTHSSGRKRKQCPECGKSLSGQLARHMRTHTGERPFACGMCGMRFSVNHNLFKHMMRAHMKGRGASSKGSDESGDKVHSNVDVNTPVQTEAQKKDDGKMVGANSTVQTEAQTKNGKLGKCANCGEVLKDQLEQRLRLRSSNSETTRVCGKCGLSFNVGHKNAFSVNMKTRLKGRVFDGRVTCTNETHPKENPVKSGGSSMSFNLRDMTVDQKTATDLSHSSNNDKLDIRRPFEKHYDIGVGSFKCNKCGRVFHRKNNFHAHSRIHAKEKCFKCATCIKSFNHRKNLILHQRSHTGGQILSCSVCDKRFGQKKLLLRHMRKHREEKPAQITCDTCGKIFSCGQNLRDHMRMHTGEKPFGCKECSKSFAHRSSLRNHMRVHTGEKPRKCTICGQGFSMASGLKAHMRVHSGEKPFACEVCGKRFRASFSLKEHMMTHIEDKLFQCGSCGKNFGHASQLQRHVRTHTGEKLRVCEKCGLVVSSSSSLSRHLKVHTGEKPFACDKCDKTFKEKRHLDRHVVYHLEEKPFRCQMCDKGYYRKEHLAAHMKTHKAKHES